MTGQMLLLLVHVRILHRDGDVRVVLHKTFSGLPGRGMDVGPTLSCVSQTPSSPPDGVV